MYKSSKERYKRGLMNCTSLVLITGASSGSGRETVKLFQQKGWNVIGTMRSPEKETVLSRLSDVLMTRLHVTDEASIGTAVAAGLGAFGGIDVLVNNAGFDALGMLEDASDDVIRQQFEVNFCGLIDVVKAVLPGMRARRSGVIVNVSSIGGKVTFPFYSLYHATKFAVEGLTESLQYELNPLGIRTKIVEPGGYKTEFAGRSMGYYGAGGLDDYRKPYDQFIKNLAQWPMSEKISEVADVIFEAATDGNEKLRYPAGHDAAPLLETRRQTEDAAFKKMIIGQTLFS